MWCWIGQIDMNKPKSHILGSWIWTGSVVSWWNGVRACVDCTILQWQMTTDPLQHDVWWNIPSSMSTIAMLSWPIFFKQMMEYYCANPVTIKCRKDFNMRIPASPLKFKVNDPSNFWELLNWQHSVTSQKTWRHTTLRILNFECKNIQNCKPVISAWRYN